MAHSFKSVSKLAKSLGYELVRGDGRPYRFHLKRHPGMRRLPFVTLANAVSFLKHRHRAEIRDVSPCRALKD